LPYITLGKLIVNRGTKIKTFMKRPEEFQGQASLVFSNFVIHGMNADAFWISLISSLQEAWVKKRRIKD
jgi:hypothetical protein